MPKLDCDPRCFFNVKEYTCFFLTSPGYHISGGIYGLPMVRKAHIFDRSSTYNMVNEQACFMSFPYFICFVPFYIFLGIRFWCLHTMYSNLYLCEANGNACNADLVSIGPVMGFLELMAWYTIKNQKGIKWNQKLCYCKEKYIHSTDGF